MVAVLIVFVVGLVLVVRTGDAPQNNVTPSSTLPATSSSTATLTLDGAVTAVFPSMTPLPTDTPPPVTSVRLSTTVVQVTRPPNANLTQTSAAATFLAQSSGTGDDPTGTPSPDEPATEPTAESTPAANADIDLTLTSEAVLKATRQLATTATPDVVALRTIDALRSTTTAEVITPLAALLTPPTVATKVVALPPAFIDDLELGPGVARLYAPFTMALDETGVVRLEVELYPVEATPTYKPPPLASSTPPPGVKVAAPPTPLPLVASAELQIRAILIARLGGVDSEKFRMIGTPENGVRAPEVGKVSWWEWKLTPRDQAALGSNRLEVVIFVERRRADGAIFEDPRADPLRFTVQVTPAAESAPSAWPVLALVGASAAALLIAGVVLVRGRLGGTVGRIGGAVLPGLARTPATLIADPLCFISYSRRDEEFTIRLGNRLRAEGVRVWRDRDDITAGASWDEEIDKALNGCTHVLFVASPSSIGSDNVLDELNTALGYKKIVIPILVETCNLPFRIRRNQWVDFRGDFETGLRKLLKDLGK
jgi:hypothetical protein